jgi:hypothetical protein
MLQRVVGLKRTELATLTVCAPACRARLFMQMASCSWCGEDVADGLDGVGGIERFKDDVELDSSGKG